MLLKLSPFQLGLIASFQGKGKTDFETYGTALSSFHPMDMDDPPHLVGAKEDKGSHFLRSRRLTFVPEDVAQTVLDIIPDWVSSPITKVTFQVCKLLAHSFYRMIDC